MGVARPTSDRRPRMASSVSSLRDCERWRGEIVRDISRKVSKIQDGTSHVLAAFLLILLIDESHL
jgi:hypothetical protein